MTKSEISKLLTIIYVYEKRGNAPSAVEVEAWFPLLADVGLQEAINAAGQHFAESDLPMTINRLRTAVKKNRAAQKPPESAKEKMRVPDADPDDPKAFIKALRAGQWESDPVPGKPPPEGIPLAAVGRKVPAVTAEEVNDESPRPRRWWLSRRQRDSSGSGGTGQTEDHPLPE